MERTNTAIKVWFFPRNTAVPSDVSSGASSVNPDAWGTPAAYYPNTSCDIAAKFSAHNIIINREDLIFFPVVPLLTGCF
jgi:hypothetical protein